MLILFSHFGESDLGNVHPDVTEKGNSVLTNVLSCQCKRCLVPDFEIILEHNGLAIPLTHVSRRLEVALNVVLNDPGVDWLCLVQDFARLSESDLQLELIPAR